jgi:hypothetical protein
MSQLNKGQKRMLALLALVLLYAVYDIASNWDSYTSYYSNKPKKKANQSKNTATGVNTLANTKVDKSYLKDWNKDPFYIPSVRRTYRKQVNTSAEIVLKLNAISYSGENSVAMINNKILKIGDSISGYRVQKIEPKTVSIIKDGKVKVLSLQ